MLHGVIRCYISFCLGRRAKYVLHQSIPGELHKEFGTFKDVVDSDTPSREW